VSSSASLHCYFNALLEVGGCILLALGMGSRVIALLLAGDMIGAYVFGDPEEGWKRMNINIRAELFNQFKSAVAA
jgi:uncharacterized membrane protein YphA (DoxX/SURF4 family)